MFALKEIKLSSSRWTYFCAENSQHYLPKHLLRKAQRRYWEMPSIYLKCKGDTEKHSGCYWRYWGDTEMHCGCYWGYCGVTGKHWGCYLGY